MKKLVVESWILLLLLEWTMRFRGLKALLSLVRNRCVRLTNAPPKPSSGDICHSVDLACVFYFKQVSSLTRSAVATLLLRSHGWDANMVIAAQTFSLEPYAWVEVGGRVVNDRPYVLDIYQVLQRC